MHNKSAPRYWVVVPAAGIGARMQTDIPKQYLPLLNKTIIEHTLITLLGMDNLEGIVVALHPDDVTWSTLAIAKDKRIMTVIGGQERADSVLAALDFLQEKVATDDWVLVHDAARPCVRLETIQQLIDTLINHEVGGILAVPASDTLKQVDEYHGIQETLDRRVVWQAQTPQMFRHGVLLAALKEASRLRYPVTDEASAVERIGHTPKAVMGRQDNIKVTHLDDLWLAEMILQRPA